MNNKEKELLQLMMQLETLMHRQMMMGHFHKSRTSMNPHRGQGRIMSLLKLKPEISQKELSILLDMSKQGLAELLAKLETANYIIRTPSTEDGRVMMVSLTESGKQVAEEITLREEDSNSLFSCLNKEEQKNLKEYLLRMIRSAEETYPEEFQHHHRHRNNRFHYDN